MGSSLFARSGLRREKRRIRKFFSVDFISTDYREISAANTVQDDVRGSLPVGPGGG